MPDFTMFNKATLGLPDHWLLGENGHPSKEAFFTRMHLGRQALRRLGDRGQSDLWRKHQNRANRAEGFLIQTKRYRKLKNCFMTSGDHAASWETLVFQKFMPGWHLDVGVSAAAEDEPPAENLDGLNAEMLELFELFTPCPGRSRGADKAHSVRTNDPIPTPHEYALFGRLSYRVFMSLLQALDEWSSSDVERQQQLADVAFACFTLFGPRALELAVEKAPQVLEYYRYVRGLTVGAVNDHPVEAAGPAVEDAVTHEPPEPPEPPEPAGQAPSTAAEEDRPASLAALYRQLEALAAAGRDCPGDLSIADRIECLVVEHLPGLRRSATLTTEEVEALIEGFVAKLVALGRSLGLDDFSRDDFVGAFRRTWLRLLDETLSAPVGPGCFDALLKAREADALGRKASLVVLRAQLAEIDADIAKQAAALSGAPYGERRQLQQQIANLRARRESLAGEAAEEQFRVVDALLPQGRALDDDPVAIEVTVSPERYHPSAFEALQAWRDRAPIEAVVEPEVQGVAARVDAPTGEPWPPAPEPTPVTPGAISADESRATVTAEPSAPEVTATIGAPAAASADPAEAMGGAEPVEDVEDPLCAPTATEAAQHDEAAQTDTALHAVATEYLDDPAQTLAALRAVAEHYGTLPSILAENVALHWLTAGRLPMAHATLETAQQVTVLSGDLLDPALLRAAFFGLQVWPGNQARESISRIQKELNFIVPQHLDELMARKPGGKLVPYLVVAATVQASLFAGNRTHAPALLRQVRTSFEGVTGRLLEDIERFANHGRSLNLEGLRNQSQEDSTVARERILAELRDWEERVTTQHSGWSGMRAALKRIRQMPEFREALSAMRDGEVGAAPVVEALIARYGEPAAVQTLMERQIQEGANGGGSGTIEGVAKNRFKKQIGELIDLARQWQALQHRSVPSDDTRAFVERLRTQLRGAKAELAARHDEAHRLEHRAGAQVVLAVIDNLLRVADQAAGVIWSPTRTRATFVLPDDLAGIAGCAHEARARFEWLAQDCGEGAFLQTMTDLALGADEQRVALLLLMLRRDAGDDVTAALDQTSKAVDTLRHTLRDRCSSIHAMADNARLENLISEERYERIIAGLAELRETLDDREPIEPVDDIAADTEALERELQGDLTARLADIEVRFEGLLSQARIRMGAEAVAAEWIDQVRRALGERSLSVADELLGELERSIDQGRPLRTVEVAGNPRLSDFLAHEAHLCRLLRLHPNSREIGHHLRTSPNGLSFAEVPEGFDAVLERLLEWRADPKLQAGGKQKRGKYTNLESLYEGVALVLRYLGFDVEEHLGADLRQVIGFESGYPFSRATLSVRPTETGQPFPLFEQQGVSSQVNVVLAFGRWTPDDLKGFLETAGFFHARTVLISARPLDNVERNAFARCCKDDELTVLHIDPVMAAFLGSLPRGTRLLPAFLQLSAPWTYYNPYTPGDARRPAPPEMRFGRGADVQKLVRHGGEAIVFGGRQLGKTTLLHEAVRRFDKPEAHQHAFYRQMDRDMDRARGVGSDPWRHARERIWREIYGGLVAAKVLRDTAGTDVEAMIEAINMEFKRSGAARVLVCLDEIDPILAIDSGKDFGIFRGLADLVNQPSCRFKVVIAGLENVKRFEGARNFPLPQLGGSLQVSILETHEAAQLVRVPLQTLGYTFEDPLQVSRILVTTNRHPGLLHIFCDKLLRSLAQRHTERVGSVRISAADIARIVNDSDVKALIRSRFDMTLNLDWRYLVIIYGLILDDRSTRFFSPFEAKQRAEDWAPSEFRPMTEKTFEALLDELVGLGVLRRSPNGGRYALRSANILDLLGSDREIEDKLLGTIEALDVDDALSNHAFSEGVDRPSPLTFRDEKLLISTDARPQGAAGAGHYSVAIVTGSPALGLSAETLCAAMPALGQFETEARGLNGGSGRYEVRVLEDAEGKDVADFRQKLTATIDKRIKDRPLMLLVPLDGHQPLATTLDLIDVAHALAPQAQRIEHRLRILFLLGPQALWRWISRPELTGERETQQTFIALERWRTTACESLLYRLGLQSDPSERQRLMDYGEGWYVSIKALCAALEKHRHRPRISRLADLASAYTPLVQAKPGVLDRFLGDTGLRAVPWALPLATALAELDTFNEEDVALAILERDQLQELDEAMAPHVIDWLCRLRVVDIQPKRPFAYRFTPGVRAALKAVSDTPR